MTWETVHILWCEADKQTGAIIAHIGDNASGASIDDRAIMFGVSGVLSLPAPPTQETGAGEGIAVKTTSGDIIIATRDIRAGYLAGLIKPGETAVFATGSQATELFKNDGSIRKFTTHDNTNTGRSIYEDMGTGGFEWVTPWGRMSWGEDGFHIFHASGASFDLGAISGMPPPLDSLGTYCTINAAMMQMNCTVVSHGADPAQGADPALITGPVLRETPQLTLATTLGNLASALTLLNSTLGALVVPSALTCAATPGPVQPVLLTPAVTTAITTARNALTTASTQIAALTPLITSTSTCAT